MTNSPQKNASTLIERPPVIAVMGHIDHGKSQLLDYIRHTNIVAKESGGITQHTSAYEVILEKLGGEKKITFLDTPGHAAFTTMRTRGAQIADIAILIVSAEEGVKPQTLEALQSIQEQKIPLVVAINKIDKPQADVEKTKQDLAEHGVFVEGYGGNIPFAAISAKAGTGVDGLLDILLLVAELEELKGDPNVPAEGFVLESHLDPRRGNTATLIIKNGTLKTGDFLVIGRTSTKIKQLNDFLGRPATKLTFSAPASIFGFSERPSVGAPFRVATDKQTAAQLLAEGNATIAEPNQTPARAGGQTEVDPDQVTIPVVIKADVAGTLEAVEQELSKLAVPGAVLTIVDKSVGAITENDVKTVSSFPLAKIIGFRVKTEKGAVALAEKNGIVIKTSDVIYQLSEWLEAELTAVAPKQVMEEIFGRVKVLKIFGRVKDKQIIGGAVVSGVIIAGRQCKIIRRDAEIARGKVLGLQLHKVKVNEVGDNEQFGAEVEARTEIVPGDYLEIFTDK